MALRINLKNSVRVIIDLDIPYAPALDVQNIIRDQSLSNQ